MIKKQFNKIKNQNIARNFISLASGNLVAQIISIGCMPIVTRIYNPGTLGEMALVLAFIGLWSDALSLRYENAILIAATDEEAKMICVLSVVLIVIVSSLGVPALWALQHFDIFKFSMLPKWTPLVALPIFICCGIFAVFKFLALRANNVNIIRKAVISRSAFNATTKIFTGIMGFGLIGLFAAEMAGAIASVKKISKTSNAWLRFSAALRFNKNDIFSVAKRYSKFPLIELPSTWIDSLALKLPLPMVAALFGPVEVGCYSLAYMIVSAPNAQISGAIGDVFHLEISKARLDSDMLRVRGLFYGLMKKLALLGLVPLFFMIALSNILVPIIFGADWTQAGSAVGLIAPWLYIGLIVSPLSRVLSLLEAQEMKLIYDLSAISLLCASYFLAKILGSSFDEFLIILSASQIVGYLIYAVLLVFIVELRTKDH